VVDPNDLIPPVITNEQVQPSVNSSGTGFNISATITDNYFVTNAVVEIRTPGGTAANYTMSNTGSLFYYIYTGYMGGNYSARIIAFDSADNSASSSTLVFNVTSVVATNHRYYERGDTVQITGRGYSPSSDVLISLQSSDGTVMPGYPASRTSNSTGSVSDTRTIPGSLSERLDTYTIWANDTLRSYLYNSTNFRVVVKSDVSSKRDNNNPAGVDVTSQLFHSDGVSTTLVSSSTEVYIDLRFQDLILEGYTLDHLVLYVEHRDFTLNPLVVTYYNGATYATATCGSIPLNTTKSIGACNLTPNLASIPNKNDIRIRLSDNNLGSSGADFSEIDFAFLDIDFSITSDLSVNILVPANVVTTLLYNDTVNNKAYSGSTTALPPAAQVTGTEATTSQYEALVYRDDSRYQSTTTTQNNYAYQSFYFTTNLPREDILDIVLTWEGYITSDASTPQDIRLYGWNYVTSAYTDIGGGRITGTNTDQEVVITLPSINYVSTSGQINILFESHNRRTGGMVRIDIFTDYIKLDISSIRTISGYQDINISAVDADGVQSCTVNFINSTGFKHPDLTARQISAYSFYNRSYTPLYSDGLYNITANCTDGTETQADSVRVRINNNGPQVYLVSPAEGAAFSTSTVTFTWNATQDSGNPLCDLIIDGVVNRSNINSINGQNTAVEVTPISDGMHNWSVTCRNAAGIPGYSQTRNFTVDTGPPVIFLNSPQNNNFTSISNIIFRYTPYDTGILSCSIYINGALNQTNTTVAANMQSTFEINNFQAGRYNWTVNCTDSFAYTGQSSTYNFTVDLDNPRINLTFPNNGDVFLGGLVMFNYTAFDDIDSLLSCNIMVNNLVEISNTPSANNTAVVQYKELTSGIKFWNVTCFDDSGRSGTSLTRNFTVQGSPTVNLVSPLNRSSLDQSDVTFVYFTEDTDGIQNCSFYVNGQLNQTNYSIANGANNNFYVYQMQEAYYNWSVGCFDNTGLETRTGTNLLTIDRTSPTVTLIAPVHDEFFETGDITFNFTVTDNLDTSLTCTLFIDGSPRTALNTNFQALNGSIQSRLETGILGGDHIWDVECRDDSGLIGYSETRDFFVGGLPIVELQTPLNNSYSPGDVTFVYYVEDSDGLSSCSLYINDVFNQSSSMITSGANNTFSVTGLAEQRLNWTVNCTDTLGLTSIAKYHWLNIDNTPAQIYLVSPNASVETSSSVLFNFTIIENTPAPLSCTIFVNGTATSHTGTNGSNTRTIESLEEGINYWNVTCTDAAGHVSFSPTYNFSIIFAPNVRLLFPDDGSTDTDGNVTFEFRVSNTNIDYCTLFINEIVNTTIYSADLIPFGTSQINVSGLEAQRLNWTVECTNTNAVSAFAFNGPWSLNIDFTPPRVILSQPMHDSNISLSTIVFNFTAFDDIAQEMFCNLTINSQVNQTDIPAQNGTPILTSVSGFVPGVYTWNVTCSDGGFTNTSLTYNFTVKAEPTIQLVSPASGYSDPDGNIVFSYLPQTINQSGFLVCNLYIDGALNSTVAPQAQDNGKVNNFTVGGISEGFHNWSVDCTDYGSQYVISEIRPFSVDLTDPISILYFPDGDYLNSTFSFNFTAIDNLASTMVCSLNNNGTIYSGLTVQNNTPYTLPVSGLNDGLYSWNVTCTDNSGRQGFSMTNTYTVSEKPVVILISPPDNTRTTDTSFTFTYLPTDNSGSIDSCSLIINDVVNKTNYTVFHGIQNNFTVFNLEENEYYWAVECNDTSGNSGRSNPYRLIIDLSGPRIDLIFPTEGGTYNYDDLNFTWNATDIWATNLFCNLTIDGITNVSNIASTSGMLTNYTVYDMAQGPHSWSVTCWDDLNNTNTSITVSFTVNAPDLTLNNTDIVFNNTNPDPNETIRINATIYNIGGATALNVPVEFWDGLPDGDGIRIGQTQLIPSLNPGFSSTVFVDWNITLGMHHIHVIINYTNVELNSTNNNATRNITVLYPVINYPLNATWTNNPTINLNFTLNDYTGNMIDYSILVNSVPNGQTGSSLDGDDTLLIVVLTEGIRTIAVRATDYFSRIKTSVPITLFVDLTPPKGMFETPNNWWFNTPTPEIFFNITDNLDPVLDYSLFVNFSLETASQADNATSSSAILLPYADGYYIVTLNSTDEAGNQNSTSITIFIDSIPPAISLLHPSDSQDFMTTAVELNFTVDDNLDQFLGCNLTINGLVNRSFINAERGQTINTTVYGLNEGTHTWSVTCWDGGLTTNINNINTSETRAFSVYVPPVISLVRPDDNNWTSQTDVTFYYDVSDDTGIENCSILLNGAIADTRFDVLNNQENSFTVFGMEGIYNWSIQCFDNTSLNMFSQSPVRRLYVDLYEPEPYIETANHTWFNTATPQIRFNVTDNLDDVLNYTIFVDGISNTHGTVQNATSTAVNLATLSDGTYTIIIEAWDDAYNRKNSSAIIIYVDTLSPSITLIAPEHENITTETEILFSFSAWDNMAASMLCNLTVDNTVRQIFNVTPGETNSTILTLTAGTHYWNVTCIDTAGNTNTSETWRFTIPLPDLMVSADYINFNTTWPEEGTFITINATVFNIGDTTASDAVIQFFVGNYSLGDQINSDFVYTIPAGQNITVNVSWLVSGTGRFDIYVIVDPPIETGGNIIEANESNNVAFRTIEVGSYTMVYGNLTGFLNIMDLSNRTLFQWDSASYNSSRIYAADYDSSINWASLQAITRDINGGFVPEDFHKIDVALGIANNSDSVNRTWSENNIPRFTGDKTVYLRQVENIPLVNSTTTPYFMTGILWDAGDGGTEYDGTQDLVFVTTVNINQPGSLGLYDYELKIPANLRLYKGPNTGAVALYTELP
jgi:hypothetical protein